MTVRPIEDVLRTSTPSFMKVPGVIGTGIGEERGKPCILVFVKTREARLEREIPSEIEGYVVRIEPVGDVRPRE